MGKGGNEGTMGLWGILVILGKEGGGERGEMRGRWEGGGKRFCFARLMDVEEEVDGDV